MRAWCAATSHGGSRWVDWLRRVVLASALCMVVLGVVGMHQLSLGHDFATPAAGGGHLEREAGHHDGVRHDVAQLMDGSDLGSRGPHDAAMGADSAGASGYAIAPAAETQTNASTRVGGPVAAWGGSGSAGGDGCPGCGQHSMAFSACLLALTLLVLTWLLTPPQVRHLPPRWRWQPATVAVLAGRPLPAMSLTVLSILRT